MNRPAWRHSGKGYAISAMLKDKNIAIEYRYANARFEKLPALADELIRLKVDVLVVSTTPAVQAAKNATRTIPIVFFGVFDPVAAGLD